MQANSHPSHRCVECTYILACLAQACHSLVDPETLRPALNAVVDRFVSDRSRPEVMAVGLNAVREICARTPLVMDATLLSDLIMYVKHRDKPVALAARSLLNLYRVLDPALLHKSQRGREAAIAGVEPLRYGETTTADGVENINLLARYREHGEQFPFMAGDGNNGDDDDGDASELSQDEGGDDDDDGISFDDEHDGVDVEGDNDEELEEIVDGEEDDEDEDEEEGEDEHDEHDDDDDDDDDDNDDVEVEDDEDDNNNAADATSKKRTSSVARLDAVRILSDKDFADLERAVEVARDAGSNAIKRKRLMEVEDEIGPLNAPIDKSVLEKGLKVAMSKEERRLKFGVRIAFCVLLQFIF
jgi:protein SDA1